MGNKKFINLIILLLTINILSPNICGKTEPLEDLQDFNDLTYIESIINESLLDLEYIHSIAENLSFVIFNAYNESNGEIAQGRYFGTKGEHLAAKIIYDNMSKLGLNPQREELKKTPVTLADVPNIISKIDILERGLTIYKNNSKVPITDYYISPVSNLTGFGEVESSVIQKIKNNRPIIGTIFEKLISLIPPYHNGILDKKYNLYDQQLLTNNFSYNNLKVVKKPYNYSLALDFFQRFKCREPFVYIDIDTMFTPLPKHPPVFKGFIYKNFFGKLPYNEQILWTIFQPNCRGVILYDYCYDAYNTGDMGVLPIIRVNRTIGEEIYNNTENYKIDFYINQSFNDSVLSYNVVGQINGTTNTNETVAIGCLYDSTWCQGTGDSAIGMAIVLGVAKYFVDHNISPKCNVQFVAFSGEEYGMRGAYYYEALHRYENITTVIDLNQLGLLQTYPRLTLRVFSNSESLNSAVSEIVNRTDYVNRTHNVTDFETLIGATISNADVFVRANDDLKKDLYKTVEFVKCYKWPHHHRDGLNHRAGDVIDFFDYLDVSITGEMIWNVTESFTC